jgi:hypothetical protein
VTDALHLEKATSAAAFPPFVSIIGRDFIIR